MNTHTITQLPEVAVSAGSPARAFTRYVTPTIRILMGLSFLVFGLNLFLNFIPPPTKPLPEGAVAFAMALMKTGYMMPLIGSTQVIVGALLLTNRFVPLALALIAPFLVNSVAFHFFLEPSGFVMAAIFSTFELYLAWAYRKAFQPMLVARAAFE
jgi:uncharacterized membrane protein YphA (DoxX/SURF4 family)